MHPGLAYDDVVLISLDTLRSDGVGANPRKAWPAKYRTSVELCTPELDELARSGTFFPNCISAAPYTSASHASFLTGQWPLRHGVFELFNHKLRSPTLFQDARRLGLRTLLKVDFPLMLGHALGFTSGVDEFLIEDDEAFLERMTDSAATLALVHFGGLHTPYGFHNLRFGGQAYVDKVRELERELGIVRQAHDERVRAAHDEQGERTASDLDLSLRYKRVIQEHFARGNYDRLFALYLAGINHFVRTRFRPFIDHLIEQLSGRRYLIVLFGDHGEEYDRESFGHQNSVADGVLRVPLIFFGPDVPSALNMSTVRSVDVAPTVLELLGARPSRARFDGCSLATTIRAGAPVASRPAFAQAYAAEQGAYLAFMRRLALTGRKTGSLAHRLLSEVVYEGDWRLERKHTEYVALGDGWRLVEQPRQLRLQRFDGCAWLDAHDAVRLADLDAQLDAYNARRRARSRVAPMTAEVRAQLAAMGYRV